MEGVIDPISHHRIMHFRLWRTFLKTTSETSSLFLVSACKNIFIDKLVRSLLDAIAAMNGLIIWNVGVFFFRYCGFFVFAQLLWTDYLVIYSNNKSVNMFSIIYCLIHSFARLFLDCCIKFKMQIPC